MWRASLGGAWRNSPRAPPDDWRSVSASNSLLAEHSLARGAELALLCLQARRDLVGVGDELAAQTEDVRSAGAARFFRPLIFGGGEARSDRSSEGEGEGDDCDLQHFMFLFVDEEIISSFISHG